MKFATEYPDIVSDITTSNNKVDIVADGFDAGIQIGEYVQRDMIAVRVSDDLRLAVFASPAYFQTRPIPKTPRDLKAHTCLAFRFKTGVYRWEFEKGRQSLTVNPQGPLVIDDSELVVEAALKGMGIGTALENSVTELITKGRLIQVLQDWCPSFPGFYCITPVAGTGLQQCPPLSERYVFRVSSLRAAFVNALHFINPAWTSDKSPTHFSRPEFPRPSILCKRSKRPPGRKIVLKLPDLDHAKSAVLNSLSSPHSRRNYEFAMEQFITWYCSEPRLALNRSVVLRFRLHLESLGLAAGTVNQRLAAVRRLAYEAADSGLLSPELAAGIRRVKGVKQLGARTGNWLTQDQARLLLEKADGDDMRSVRDLAMISVLIGCGLRRAELSALTVEDLQIRQGHWALVDLVGKGGHVRTVPVPVWDKGAVDRWRESAKVTAGRIFRAVSRHGTPWGKGISENVFWYVVRRCAERVQLDHIAPHDLRRTCAKLCHMNGGELEQIQFLLGHVSVLTTERYLGCKQNLEQPVNDRFGCLFSKASVKLR